MKRRKFMTYSVAATGVGVLAQTLEACSVSSSGTSGIVPTPPPKPTAKFTIDLTDPNFSALNSVGGVVFTQGIFIVCQSANVYIALSPICTHMGCTVNFDSSNHDFLCPCHGSTYDLNGRVVVGPATANLKQYQVTLSGTQLKIF